MIEWNGTERRSWLWSDSNGPTDIAILTRTTVDRDRNDRGPGAERPWTGKMVNLTADGTVIPVAFSNNTLNNEPDAAGRILNNTLNNDQDAAGRILNNTLNPEPDAAGRILNNILNNGPDAE